MKRQLDRRRFVALSGLGTVGWVTDLLPAVLAAADPREWDPLKPFPRVGEKLKVQPLLMYSLPSRKEQASWKSWGGVQTESAVTEEVQRITSELHSAASAAEFPVEFQPVIKVESVESAQRLANGLQDVTLVYACTGSGALLRACTGLTRDRLVFVRHQSGPIYYWYEALSTRYLATESLPSQTPAQDMHVDDVIVDDVQELLWRLRALFAVKNLKRTRVLALGGPWGKYAQDAPEKARERFQIGIVDVPYETFAPKLRRAREDRAIVAAAEKWTDRYLALPHTKLQTDHKFIVNAFVLYRVFKELLEEQQCQAFTIKSCMGTIIPMSETTACLTLGLMNDEGLIAFCESDFVIIPAGLLLRYIAGRPVFLHNSTFPHRQVVTCAHCTCPRRLDGVRYEPAKILTHYESEYGAAPKVDMPIGQKVTFIDPEYSTTRWVGFTGTVKGNPSYEICRSQQDVEISGDWRRLVREVRDSHWVMCYGDFVREAGYASRKLGLQWVDLEDCSAESPPIVQSREC